MCCLHARECSNLFLDPRILNICCSYLMLALNAKQSTA
uniref:Uncharacterized protein n=1 Tax=Arundo donax TaxID=35708 RepID=A0A0A9BV16_ARUDO